MDRLGRIERINDPVFGIFAEFDVAKVKAEEKPVAYALARKLIEAGEKLDADARRCRPRPRRDTPRREIDRRGTG